jgi:hypothetical protein
MATTTKTPKKPAARKPAAKKAATAAKKPAAAAKAQQKTADRVLHVPIGATLVARDAVTETVSGTVGNLRSTFSSTDAVGKELQLRRKRLEAEMQRFERRGATARTRIERDLKARRTRLEKDLKARRSTAETLVQHTVDRVTERVSSVR